MASVSEKNTELQLTIMQHKLEKQMSDLAQQAMGGGGQGGGGGGQGPPRGLFGRGQAGFACYKCGGPHRQDSIHCPHNQQNLQQQHNLPSSAAQASNPLAEAQSRALQTEIASLRDQLQQQELRSQPQSPIRSFNLQGQSQGQPAVVSDQGLISKMECLLGKMTTLEVNMGVMMSAQDELSKSVQTIADLLTTTSDSIQGKVTEVAKEIQIVKGKEIQASKERVDLATTLDKHDSRFEALKAMSLAIGRQGATRGGVLQGCEAMLGTLAKAISLSMGEHARGAYTPFEDEEEGEEEDQDHVDLTHDEAPPTPAERAFADMSEFDGEASEAEAAGVGVGSPRIPHARYTRPAPGAGVDPRGEPARPRRLVRVPQRLAAATPPAAAGDKRGAGGSSGDRPRRKAAVSSA